MCSPSTKSCGHRPGMRQQQRLPLHPRRPPACRSPRTAHATPPYPSPRPPGPPRPARRAEARRPGPVAPPPGRPVPRAGDAGGKRVAHHQPGGADRRPVARHRQHLPNRLPPATGAPRPPRAPAPGRRHGRRPAAAAARCGHSQRTGPRPPRPRPTTAPAIRRLSSWNCFLSFHCSGTCGASAPTTPPLAPAPTARHSMTRTRAPPGGCGPATDRPKIPAPRTVRSGLAKACTLCPISAATGVGQMADHDQTAELSGRAAPFPSPRGSTTPISRWAAGWMRRAMCFWRQRPARTVPPGLPHRGTGLWHRPEHAGRADRLGARRDCPACCAIPRSRPIRCRRATSPARSTPFRGPGGRGAVPRAMGRRREAGDAGRT